MPKIDKLRNSIKGKLTQAAQLRLQLGYSSILPSTRGGPRGGPPRLNSIGINNTQSHPNEEEFERTDSEENIFVVLTARGMRPAPGG